MGMNKTIIVGRIGQDAEVKTFPNGGKVATFSVATAESWKDKDSGEWQEKTDWHRVVSYQDGLISIIEKHAVKGRLVGVTGKLQYRTYRKDGEQTDRTVAEIVLDIRGEIDFLTPKPETGA